MEADEVNKMVAQYLQESGYGVSSMAFLQETGLAKECTALLPGSTLRTILDNHYEAQEAKKQAHVASPASNFPQLERPGDDNFVADLFADIDETHDGNILAARSIAGTHIVSGAADKLIKLRPIPEFFGAEGDDVKSAAKIADCKAPVLAIDVHPKDPNLVAVGDMAGGCVVLSVKDGASTTVYENRTAHRKFVVKVKWSSCGGYFATASHDRHVKMFECSEDVQEKKEFGFRGPVESIAFTPPTVAEDDAELLVCARDDHRIHLINLKTLEHRNMNLNANGDDWVSFTVMDLSVSPDGELVLLSTDKDRIILISRRTGEQLRNYYGAGNDAFSHPRHCWHPSGLYIYATSQSHNIIVWEVATGKVVGKLEGHESSIRDLSFEPRTKTLISTGFDKTIKLWRKIL